MSFPLMSFLLVLDEEVSASWKGAVFLFEISIGDCFILGRTGKVGRLMREYAWSGRTDKSVEKVADSFQDFVDMYVEAFLRGGFREVFY